MLFNFTAIRQSGERYDGEMESEDKLSLAKKLKENGDILLNIKEKNKKGLNLNFLVSIKNTDLISFARNMAGLMQAGVALARSIEILEHQTTNVKMKAVLHNIIEDIRKGDSFSDSLARHPKVFEPLFISMMKAGEESGNLIGTLKEVQIHLERSYTLKRKVKGAMTYPLVILGAMSLIGLLMFKYVVPSLLKVFLDFKIELPLSTRLVLWLANTINHNFILLILGIIGLVVGFYYLLKRPGVKKIMSTVVLKLPVIGGIAKQTFTARTARTLSSLLKSGVTASRSIEITKEIMSNFNYKAVLDEALANIEKGIPISKAFQDHPDLYPIMMGDMIEVGEESGKVGDMLVDVANFYEEEVDQKTKNLSSIVEPLLMIFIGSAVGFFAIAMMTPMYSMLDSVN